ncbi:MAG TPA: phytanoyl-CoA dioxygenase family protein [Alphaproteobacteria bacterium]|nr:phytanoyl-CoA dioxygenase family protein [Alphaproteobacteria bacterium]
MRVRYFDRSASVADVKSHMEEWGFAVVVGRQPTAIIEAVGRDINRHTEGLPFLEKPFFGGALKKIDGFVAKSPAMVDLMSDPFVIDLAEAILGPEPLLNGSAGFILEKGNRPQDLHHDDIIYQPYLPRIPGGPQSLIHYMFAITEFTAKNGATCMIPGSHLWPAGREPTEEDEVLALEMPPGGFAVWLGSTWHGAGRNTTERPRIGADLGFNCGWLRPHEAYHLLVPPALARSYPKRVREVLGYRAHRGMLGCIDQRNPMDLLGFPQ